MPGCLERKPPRPADGGGLEALLGLRLDHEQDAERVPKPDVAELGRADAYRREAARLDGATQAGIA